VIAGWIAMCNVGNQFYLHGLVIPLHNLKHGLWRDGNAVSIIQQLNKLLALVLGFLAIRDRMNLQGLF
jgi:hypothetical protein